MRLTCYPTEYDEKEGLLPIEAQDLQIAASPEELRALAGFLSEAAEALELQPGSNPYREFGDSKPNPKAGIGVMVFSDHEDGP